MAPLGAQHRPVTPGPDPKARISGLLYLIIMMLPYSSGLPTRTERLISENDLYYWAELENDRIQCRLCPEGTYVKEHCTSQYAMGRCEICAVGTYIAFPSGLTECLPCSRCRNDQEEVASCSTKKDAICHCEKGTFCPPNQLCEICKPCTASCPDDQVVKAPCNATSDILCSNPGTSTDSENNVAGIVTASVVSVVILIIIIILISVYVSRRKKKTGSKILGKLTFHICKGNKDGDEAEGDLLPKDILQFREGINSDTKDEIIAKSTVIILNKVPVQKFGILMQSLGVSYNEIQRAREDNQGNVANQNNAMLQAWYQKNEFDINSLLKSLRRDDMEKAASDIASELIKDGLFVRQTQHSS